MDFQGDMRSTQKMRARDKTDNEMRHEQVDNQLIL